MKFEKMGVCMSINVANSQVTPEEDDNMDFIKNKVEDEGTCGCLKKIFCFLCI